MLEQYLTIFYQVCIQFAPLAIPVFGVFLIVSLIAGLLFDR